MYFVICVISQRYFEIITRYRFQIIFNIAREQRIIYRDISNNILIISWLLHVSSIFQHILFSEYWVPTFKKIKERRNTKRLAVSNQTFIYEVDTSTSMVGLLFLSTHLIIISMLRTINRYIHVFTVFDLSNIVIPCK